MPALSPTMETGTIASWAKKPGDKVNPGDILAQVETDKATVAFESTEEGYLAAILLPEGTAGVKLGTPVAVLVENEGDVAALKGYTPPASGGAAPAAAPAAPAAAAPAAPAAAAPAAAPAAPAPSAPSSPASGDRVFATPYARKLAADKNISLSEVQGSGPNRRIVGADIENFQPQAKAAAVAAQPKAAAASPAAPAPAGEFIDIAHSNVRKTIAKRLTASKQEVPHYYLTVELNMDKLLKLRKELNGVIEKKDKNAPKISVNDLIIKASALALRKVPAVNSSWHDSFVRQYNYVDISVAVSTPTGLITPIVKDADLKGLSVIGGEVKELAGRAKDNKLKPEEYQGGTFTISNLGMFGVKSFTAIINPPQACILAVGATEERVVVNPAYKGAADQEKFTTANVMSVTLSCDHRVVDGAVGAQWLQSFRGFVENPVTMLL